MVFYPVMFDVRVFSMYVQAYCHHLLICLSTACMVPPQEIEDAPPADVHLTDLIEVLVASQARRASGRRSAQ